MLKKLLGILLFMAVSQMSSQITGEVKDENGKALPYVNIYTESGSKGTTTNEEGIYELKITEEGKYTLVYQFLGYKTLKKEIIADAFPITINVVLKAESTSLDEVTVQSGDNPANRIIRNAIDNRELNAERLESFTADFYSRGLWRIKNAPEKILGQDVGDLGGGLDSTRSGIVYLSETISEIAFQKPDDFKEKIIASKVSGDDNGFSLNSAQEAYFSFYENTLEINSEMVSPIAEYAFNYYRYILEGTFFDNQGNMINKIQVTPKRSGDRIFSGYIYIVEDLWQIYGVELTATGQAIQVAPIEELVFRQNYKYSKENELYIQISQSIDFSFKLFGFGGDGRFTAVYSNYNFNPEFDKNSFGREILSFQEQANKKDSLYWKKQRPIPLTGEEINDYVRKDSIQEVRSTKKYKDSVDAVRNKFGITDILFGYTHQNSWKHRNFGFSAPISGIGFNTVQGWNTDVNLTYTQRTGEDQENYWRIYSDIDYGLSEERLRLNGGFEKKFNNFNRPFLRISGGIASEQINEQEPISPLLNSISTIFFERNYMKLYEKSFANVGYGQDIFPGIRLFGEIGWENRKPLINQTDHVFIDREDKTYTSNNPLEPENFGSLPFEEHSLVRSNIYTDITFGQKYMSYPNGRYNVYESKYPKLKLSWEKGFGASENQYNFDQFKAQIRQNLNLGNKGEFQYLINGGLFSNADDISLVDYQHFNANQTRIGFGSYVGKFNLMPYYNFSTNQNYAEFHAEHDFEGWLLGKLPLINKLNFNLILGAHRLTTDGRSPYSEYSVGIDNLGFGKYRFLRLDYVVSDFGGKRDGAFIFGLKF
ncbi:DUF5686 and carboxypeptidase regulatory-like domain-containing protein [Christiangramia sp. SM2212]|uniref:DUF5686 and carboxypeptidase regulatory-like domain-containing protein n=1 Tax=Christiangramia sediminicola TaxID=3073267 RepID=A0ABU1ER03_9FLAO|nr:DUF5686 and carboxypeptidase regulatory-like domain-containing protein [Christiangramia sp. SM2212]MDR5590812.1 DUF5686 and carboxypeptidase regulatory-like domain-containing protein [Christiangramia sp. SM2212]